MCWSAVIVLLCRLVCSLNILQQCTGHASPLACLFSDELCLAVSPCVSPFQCRVSLTLNQLAFGYWLMKTRLTVHMVPIEELPSTRASIVLCLSSSLNSDVTGLDNSKLDFQMKYQWYSRLSWTKAIKFDFFFPRDLSFFFYFFTAV